jgi:hypothetical protein
MKTKIITYSLVGTIGIIASVFLSIRLVNFIIDYVNGIYPAGVNQNQAILAIILIVVFLLLMILVIIRSIYEIYLVVQKSKSS